MYIEYEDILRRIPEQPVWWLNGVPRYDAFTPRDLDVYTQEALLVHIQCFCCGKDYQVGIFNAREYGADSFRALLTEGNELDIGDPPNACCRDGSSTGSVEIAVLQFWERVRHVDWRRVPEFERLL